MADYPDLDLSIKHRSTTSEAQSDTEPQYGTKSLDSSSSFEDTQLAGGDGRNSPPPNCAICLGRCRNKCFADVCMHQFCFACLLEWVKVKPECPLCKHTLKVIRHSFKSVDQFEEYLVQPVVNDTSDLFSSSSDDSDFESTNYENSDETGSVVELDSCPISDQSAINVLSSSSSDELEFVPAFSGTTNRALAEMVAVNSDIETHSISTTSSDTDTDTESFYCDVCEAKKIKLDVGVENANAAEVVTNKTCILKSTEHSIAPNREALNQGASTSSGLQVPYCCKRLLTSTSNFPVVRNRKPK